MSDGSLKTSTHPQGSEIGLSGKKTKTCQPESQQESGLLSLQLPTHTGHVQQVFTDHSPPTAAHSYPDPKLSFTNTSISAALGNCLARTCF